MSKIYDIHDIPQDVIKEVGGKARGLNQLIEFGYRVPKAFIITDIDPDESFEAAAAKYEMDGYGAVSVRSSASLEDGVDYSAAGQFSTVLNVKGKNALKEAARQCLASLNNSTAKKYSEVFLRSASNKMTIVVQAMVDAEYAGVIFSRAPMRPGFVLVEAVPGLGENLVSGKMAAQQFRVRGEKIEHMPDAALLTRDQVIKLGKAGKEAEQLFGTPMDLEWAIDRQGKIQWLQARPITIGESVNMNELDCDADASSTVYTTGNIGEVIPGAMTPLTISTNLLSLDWAVMKAYVDTGCFDCEQAPYSMIAPYYNHGFFNMTNMYRVAHCLYGCTKESTDIAICGKILEGMPDIPMKDKNPLVRLKNMIPFLKLVMGGEKAYKGMKKVVESISFNLEDSTEGIYRQILDNFHYLKEAHYWHYVASYSSGGTAAMLSSAIRKAYADEDAVAAAVAGCLTQIEDFESANILKMMRELAGKMLDEEPALAKADAQHIGEYFDKRASSQVKDARDEFMKRHGYRGILENELMNLPWRDNKESFYSSLRSVLASYAQQGQVVEKPWEENVQEVLSHFKAHKHKSIRSSIKKARRGVCHREYTKSRIIYVLDQFKQAYRQLAALMVSQGYLPDAECIYFLTQEEIGRLIKGENALVKKALARRRLFPQQRELRFAYSCLGVPVPLKTTSSAEGANVLTGTPVSRGIAEGVARVVHSEADAAEFRKGEIMVTACTDIGWSPYYNVISGLVTEIGSALSHGVVVAREYALPTVVNVTNAMGLIKTGDRIRIDGNNGTVEIISHA